MTLRFDGTRYAGWQVQQNAVTVQEVLQDAAQRVLGHRPGITGCSRTDSGVHALMFCCHLDTDSSIPAERIPAALCANLPEDIAVTAAKEVPADFHARYSCKSKEYLYKLYRSPVRDPFLEPYALRVSEDLSLPHMRAAAVRFCRRADFSAFCASGSSVQDHIRTIFECDVEERGKECLLRVRGDGFLYHMVRIMAGTLLEVGLKRLPPEYIDALIQGKDRTAAGKTAPAKALYLADVEY